MFLYQAENVFISVEKIFCYGNGLAFGDSLKWHFEELWDLHSAFIFQ